MRLGEFAIKCLEEFAEIFVHSEGGFFCNVSFRKANNKSGSTRKVVKPRMRKETQLSIPRKAIKNVLSRYSRCPVKPTTVRAVQER